MGLNVEFFKACDLGIFSATALFDSIDAVLEDFILDARNSIFS